jgi:flavin reductase (DIM6/NTAB) family NADH-FMN oxidoreductase RutF
MMCAVLEDPNTAVAAAVPSVSPAVFRDTMRALPGGVCVIATGREGRRAGFTATAVCSVTADPPRLLICVNRGVTAYGQLAASGKLSINVLARGQQEIANLFAGGVPAVKGEERFQATAWTQMQDVPVLEEACASFVCSVAEMVEQSTHTVFICDVLDARRVGEDESDTVDSLVYANGRFMGLQG